MTHSLFAAPRLRSVGLFIVCLALTFPFLGTAQDPPSGGGQGQKGQEKGGQKGDQKGGGQKEGGQKEETKEDRSKAALEKIKGQTKKEGGEVKSVEMERAGVARKQVEDIRSVQRIPASINRADQTQVTTGKGDQRMVRRWARYQLALFTDPEQDKNVAKNHDDVRRLFEQKFGDEYHALLKRELIAAADFYVNELVDQKVSAVAKVNMISLIDELHHMEPAQKQVTGVNALLNTLRNHEKHGDAVLYVAMNALANAKRLGLTTVELERESAKVLMRVARRGELQPLLLETLCKTLGEIGIPFEGLVNEAAEIATFLANIATNENLAERTRIEAAVALGRLTKQGVVQGYAFEVEAWVHAKTYQAFLNWAIANRKADKPSVSAAVVRYLGARLYDAARRSLEQAAGAPGQDRLRTLLSAIEPSLKDLFDDKDPDAEPVAQWLQQNAAPPLKLTRRAQEIRPVPKAAAANASAPPAGGTAAAGAGK